MKIRITSFETFTNSLFNSGCIVLRAGLLASVFGATMAQADLVFVPAADDLLTGSSMDYDLDGDGTCDVVISNDGLTSGTAEFEPTTGVVKTEIPIGPVLVPLASAFQAGANIKADEFTSSAQQSRLFDTNTGDGSFFKGSTNNPPTPPIYAGFSFDSSFFGPDINAWADISVFSLDTLIGEEFFIRVNGFGFQNDPVTNGGRIFAGAVPVPEPSGLVILAFVAAALSARRRWYA